MNDERSQLRVLIVDDSATSREMLKQILSTAPGITVVGAARDGNSAIDMACELKPDVITMDVYMPDMNGYEATEKILELLSVPIVIVSAKSKNHEPDFKAMQAGAVAVVTKPGFVLDRDFQQQAKYLISTVRSMSEVKVVRHRHKPYNKNKVANFPVQYRGECRIAVIGISTGGPPILARMLEQLPEQLPFPVCLIQHIASGFSTSLSEWLAKHSRMPVHCMEDGGTLAAGNIYIAPGGSIAGLKNASTFSVSPANDTLPSPSIDVFFEAVEKHYGNKCIAVLMSGMGRDGANGLLKLRNAGAETIVQDRESSVVYGMPGEALELAAARHIMSPDEIVEFIKNVDCSA